MKWEYLLEPIGIAGEGLNSVQEMLNKLGKDGWEIVTVWTVDPSGTYALFKKPE